MQYKTRILGDGFGISVKKNTAGYFTFKDEMERLTVEQQLAYPDPRSRDTMPELWLDEEEGLPAVEYLADLLSQCKFPAASALGA